VEDSRERSQSNVVSLSDVLRLWSTELRNLSAGESGDIWARRSNGAVGTIFRLVRGEESPDKGIVKSGVRLGLLDQHVHFEPGSTVHESALAAFGHLQQIEHEMHELEHHGGSW
jgi:hypothetical protein